MEIDGKVYLEADIPEITVNTEIVTTYSLTLPRISEVPYESADGTPIFIDKDYAGSERSNSPAAGPLETLKKGKQKILVWKNNYITQKSFTLRSLLFTNMRLK